MKKYIFLYITICIAGIATSFSQNVASNNNTQLFRFLANQDNENGEKIESLPTLS